MTQLNLFLISINKNNNTNHELCLDDDDKKDQEGRNIQNLKAKILFKNKLKSKVKMNFAL